MMSRIPLPMGYSGANSLDCGLFKLAADRHSRDESHQRS